jgi:Tfp pilus assembly protein PilP
MTMKLVKTSANLLAVLVMSLWFVAGLQAQAKPAQTPVTKAKTAKVPKTSVPPKTAKAPKATKPVKAASAEASGPTAPATDKVETANKRDPFTPLINDKKESQHLPPGKAGLVIATVHVDGAVRSGSTMIAVVSNPEQSVYFIREGDRLYDGDVEKIGLDGVTFRENSKDAFGKPVERVVTKRIYASAGEQQ